MPAYALIAKKGQRIPAYSRDRIVVGANSVQEAVLFAKNNRLMADGVEYICFSTEGSVRQPMLIASQFVFPAEAESISVGGRVGIRGQNRPAGERDDQKFADLPDAAMGVSPEGSMFSEADPMAGITEAVIVQNGNIVDAEPM